MPRHRDHIKWPELDGVDRLTGDQGRLKLADLKPDIHQTGLRLGRAWMRGSPW